MTEYEQLAAAAAQAARQAATLETATKNGVLTALAERVERDAEALLSANERDYRVAEQAGLSTPKLRRLKVSGDSIAQIAEGLRQIATLPDPVGQVAAEYRVPSGLGVQRVRCPLGVIMMIYESRPNVTIDAFSLCFKAGNACILKGGREAQQTNEAFAALAHEVLAERGVDPCVLTLITTSDREQMRALLALDQYIDLVIPRGGTALIEFVHAHARMPTVQHFHGVCHIYVDREAELAKAVNVCATAKTSAPATCNAAEAVLVHAEIAAQFVPALVTRLQRDGVTVRGDEAVRRLGGEMVESAGDEDWGAEYLDLIMAVRVVSDLDAAIAHIDRYGSKHTDAILTTNAATAEAFLRRVQSSCALWNASTRFNDGFQLGLGSEIGISTSKIHAFGPMGLEELTTRRFVVRGDWQTR